MKVTTNETNSDKDAHATINGGSAIGLKIERGSEVQGNLTLISGHINTITDEGSSGVVTVDGNLTATTNANNGSITLNDLAVDGTIGLNTHGTGSATVVNDAGLQFGASTVGGSLHATSTTGNITQSGTLDIEGTTTLITSANDATINLGTSSNAFTGALLLTTNDSGADTAGDVSIHGGTTALVMGASTIDGDLTLTSTATGNNPITDTGTLKVRGTTTVSASGVNVVLNSAANNFQGAVAINGVNVTMVDAGAIDLGASTVTGTYTLTAGGAVTDSGALVISGVTTVNASSGDVTLNSAANNFQGAVVIDGVNVTMVDAGAIDLGAATVSGTYGITAGGPVTDSGTQEIAGITTISASGQNVTLDTATNNFANEVRITGAAVTLVDEDAIDLGTSTVSGAYTLTAGGDVTNSGALAITGATTVSASGQDITLNTATNNFQGAVGITGANVSVVDAGAIVLGASTVSGTYAVTATSGGSITNTGALAITNGATFTVANGQSISLNQSNTFSSTVTFASSGTIGSVTINDSNAFDLKALTTSGDLTVTAGGAFTNSGTLVIPGTATISASGQDVILNDSSNDFGTLAITGANVAIIDTNAIILGASTVSGTYSVTTDGAITNSGTQEITGVTTLVAGSGNDITLNTSTNNFAAAVVITSGRNVAITDEDTIDLGAATVSGTYGITAGGPVTDSGTQEIAGVTTISASGQNVTLDTATNNFADEVRITGAAVTLVDEDAIDLGSVDGFRSLHANGGWCRY